MFDNLQATSYWLIIILVVHHSTADWNDNDKYLFSIKGNCMLEVL